MFASIFGSARRGWFVHLHTKEQFIADSIPSAGPYATKSEAKRKVKLYGAKPYNY